jgi:hypothetical protein
MMFDDVEATLLDGFRTLGIGATGVASREVLLEHGARLGFGAARLQTALKSLEARGCVRLYGGDRVGLTEQGFLSASATPQQY